MGMDHRQQERTPRVHKPVVNPQNLVWISTENFKCYSLETRGFSELERSTGYQLWIFTKKSLNGGSFYHSYGINFTNEEFNHELLLVHYIKGVYGIILWNNYQAKSFLPTIILHQTPKRYPQNSRSGYPSTSHERIYSGILHFKPPTEIPIKYEGGPKTL